MRGRASEGAVAQNTSRYSITRWWQSALESVHGNICLQRPKVPDPEANSGMHCRVSICRRCFLTPGKIDCAHLRSECIPLHAICVAHWGSWTILFWATVCVELTVADRSLLCNQDWDSVNDCIIDAIRMNTDTQIQLLHHLQSYDEGTHRGTTYWRTY